MSLIVPNVAIFLSIPWIGTIQIVRGYVLTVAIGLRIGVRRRDLAEHDFSCGYDFGSDDGG